jgi:hypothetical protein
MDTNNKLSKRPFLSVWTAGGSQSTCSAGKETRNRENMLKERADLARKAYGRALFEIYCGFTFHEKAHCTLESVKEAPELYDGSIAGVDVINDLVNAYFSLLQAERDQTAGRVVDDECIDKLIAAYNDWMDS